MRKGFLFIELLFFIAILGVATLALFSLLMYTTRTYMSLEPSSRTRYRIALMAVERGANAKILNSSEINELKTPPEDIITLNGKELKLHLIDPDKSEDILRRVAMTFIPELKHERGYKYVLGVNTNCSGCGEGTYKHIKLYGVELHLLQGYEKEPGKWRYHPLAQYRAVIGEEMQVSSGSGGGEDEEGGDDSESSDGSAPPSDRDWGVIGF